MIGTQMLNPLTISNQFRLLPSSASFNPAEAELVLIQVPPADGDDDDDSRNSTF